MTTPKQQGRIDSEKGEFPVPPQSYTQVMVAQYLTEYDRVSDEQYKEIGA